MTQNIQTDATSQALAEEVAAIVAASNDAFICASIDGTITLWNPGAERLYGYSSAEMIGRKLATLAPPGTEDAVARLASCLDRNQPNDQYQTTRRTKSGEVISVSVKLTPIHDEHGAVLGLSMVSRDDSERANSHQTLRVLLERELSDEPDLLATVQSKLDNPRSRTDPAPSGI